MKDVKRAWQRMLSGRRLDLLDPSPLDIELEDIAHGLARVARWNGQTSGDAAFSVAQHSLLVDDIAGRLKPGLTAAEHLARSEEQTSELQSLMRISYAVLCFKKKKINTPYSQKANKHRNNTSIKKTPKTYPIDNTETNTTLHKTH